MTCEFIPSVKDPHTCKTCGSEISGHRGYRKAGKPRKLTDAQDRELVAWYRTCRTVRQKAQELGVNENTIYNTLARLGVLQRSS
jgi:transposase-like protein